MTDRSVKLAYVSAVANAAIIGLSFLFTKIALAHTDPFDTLTYRFIVSFAVISIVVWLSKIRLTTFRGKSLFYIVLLGTLYPVSFFVLQAFGLLHTTSAEGGIIHAFTPVLTLILAAIFLREKTTFIQKASILSSIAGVVFIFLMKGSTFHFLSFTGTLLLLLSCLAIAAYSVLARSLLKTHRPIELTYVLLGFGCIAFLLASLVNHAKQGTWSSFVAPLSDGTFIVSIAYLGVMASLVTALTANYSLSKLNASKVSVFSNLSTIVSIIAGAVFLGEEVRMYHVIGSVFIIAGVIGTNYKRSGNILVDKTAKRARQSHS